MTIENQQRPDDPRFTYTKVAETLGQLIATVEAMPPDTLTAGTPCPEFTVTDLLDHVMMVARRVVVIGSGGHWSDVDHEALGSGWGQAFRSSIDAATAAWGNPSKMDQMFEVPWGRFPGGPVMLSYTGELAVHSWDLATATDQPVAIDDAYLHGALMAAKFIPAEGRDTEELPFGAVVDPGPDAPILDQLAGWMGRKVI